MKPPTIDMLRAHLMVASLTAVGAEMLMLLVLLALPVSEHVFSSTPFRLLSLALIISGVLATRQFAHAAFELALRGHHATVPDGSARPVALTANCPRRYLVILHLRLTGRPFVLAEH